MTKTKINKLQKEIARNVSNLHPDNPITLAMQKRYRELDNLKERL